MELDRKEHAVSLHKDGYNCAQAVACTYCDLFGIDEETAFCMTEGYGFGCGMQEICGALTGAFAVAGMANSSGNIRRGITKKSTYDITGAMGKKFCEINGSMLCRELRGTPEHPTPKTCGEYIADACQLLEDYLKDAHKGK